MTCKSKVIRAVKTVFFFFLSWSVDVFKKSLQCAGMDLYLAGTKSVLNCPGVVAVYWHSNTTRINIRRPVEEGERTDAV